MSMRVCKVTKVDKSIWKLATGGVGVGGDLGQAIVHERKGENMSLRAK